MKPAADSMHEKIKNAKFKNPTVKIINNVTADSESNIDDIKKLLIEQIFSTVRWRESIIKMHELGLKILLKLVQEKFYREWLKEQLKE